MTTLCIIVTLPPLGAMLDALANSPLISAVFGGLLSLAATWWTLRRGFKNQVRISEDEARQRQKSAGWALIAEMSGNLTRLQALANLAKEGAPTANMRELLSANREVLDRQLPILGSSLGVEALRTLTAAYATAGTLHSLLAGKWRISPPTDAPTVNDVALIKETLEEFDKALRIVAVRILTSEEVKQTGLEIITEQKGSAPE